ncbi:MAG: hypothetical protein FVQ77_15125 [Cytophagales bacterium]|nr:hypothetical protein [Cytophagales bacterium]
MPVPKRKNSNKTINVSNYSGKWVAIIGYRVVDSAVTFKKLMEQLRNQKFAKQPAVMRVPRDDEGPYILLL